MSHVFRVGLTGGIGSGKTTVSNIFRKLGVPVFDADVTARQVVEPGKPAYRQIVELFGNQVLDDKGYLRRDLIREIVFTDDTLKNRLESIIHPEVLKEMELFLESCDSPYCILSIPLLLEGRENYSIDRILVVDADEEIQLQRAMERDNLPKDQIAAIIKSQIERKQRLEAADDIIDNSGKFSETERQVIELHRKYLSIASPYKTSKKSTDK